MVKFVDDMWQKIWEQVHAKKQLLAFFVVALFAGFLIGHFYFPSSLASTCDTDLPYLRPSLDCIDSDAKEEILSKLRDRLKVQTQGYLNSNKAMRISVFVRDLSTNRFAEVNDSEVYYLASLLKLPLLIGGFKLAEVEPRILDQTVRYTGAPNLYGTQYYDVPEKLEVGKVYTVKELMRRAVVNSDNTAAQILFDYYPNQFMDRIMEALGLRFKKESGETENLVTTRSYANVFRMLYNTSYLTSIYSNEALSILTKASFNKGLIAKLPSDVVVAHKFGERSFTRASTSEVVLHQLHECGLVYVKGGKDPYTICVMTEGRDFNDLEEILQQISLSVYDEMSQGTPD